MSTPLLIDADVERAIRDLVALAQARPVDICSLPALLRTPEGKAEHMAQMTAQTILIPIAYMVTFSIEIGQPCGPCRHMSMSVARAGRVPNAAALWLVAEKFGFTGSLEKCVVWTELLRGHGQAINVVQPIKQDASIGLERVSLAE